jgi:hypothetical protein
MAEQSQFDAFKKTWNDLITKIETESIDGDGVEVIRARFNLDHLINTSNNAEQINETFLLESKLQVALMIANSRFRLANRGVLAKFFGGLTDKIPVKEIVNKA